MRGRVLLALGAALVFTAGCNRDGAGRATTTPVTARSSSYLPMADSLCRAAAEAGQPVAARRTFFDGAHQPLHTLAAEVAERDRPVAARLLEAKESVESAFDGGDLGPAFDRLLTATAAALEVVGGPALACRRSATAGP